MSDIIHDMEKLAICSCLKYAKASSSIPLRICSELTFEKFGDKDHKLIYKAISTVVLGSEIPTISNVLLTLGEDADIVGGEPALRGLLNFSSNMEITDIEGSWENAVKVVDTAGRARSITGVFDSYASIFSDLKSIVYNHFGEESLENVLSNFLNDIKNSGGFGEQSSYTHVSSLDVMEGERLETELSGQSYNCLPVMFPSFATFGIPRIGVLNVLAGLTSSGKTQLALQQFLGFGLHLGLSGSDDYATYNALEDSALNLYRRMACCISGIDSTRLEHNLATQEERDRYDWGRAIVKSLPLYINDKSTITSQEVMLEQALLSNSAVGRRVFGVYDYIELFGDNSKESEVLRLGNIARALHAYASDNFTCELLLTQYPNLPFGAQIGGLKARHSGSIADACKCFMEMWNYRDLYLYPGSFPNFKKGHEDIPDYANTDFAYLLVHKNSQGKKGYFPLRWQAEYTRFSEPGIAAGDMYNFDSPNSPLASVIN